MLAKFVISLTHNHFCLKKVFTETSNHTRTLSAASVFQHFMNDSSSFVNLEMSSSSALKFSSHISLRIILVGLMPRCLNLISLCEAIGDSLRKVSTTQRHYQMNLLLRDML